MAQDAILENPSGAFKTVADYTLGVTASGEVVTPELETATYRANEAIAVGQALMWVAPTTTVPISVGLMTAAANDRLFAGAALEAGAAGDYIRVVTRGHCLIAVGSTTPASGNFVIVPDATTGVFGTDASPDVADTMVGINWGVKDANNLAFAYIDRGGLAEPVSA